MRQGLTDTATAMTTAAGAVAKRSGARRPRAEPMDRRTMFVPVTTPRQSQLTTDCTATISGDRTAPALSR